MTDLPLKPGDPAPDFTCPASGGTPLSLADFRGRPLILYFYAQDDSGSCRNQALDFAAAVPRLAEAGVALLGVSKDSVAKHDKFIAKRGLPFRLLSDEDGALCEAYGVWGEKTLYGRNYMGIIRTTFLIGADGRIAQVWTVTRVKGHVDEVLAAAEAL